MKISELKKHLKLCYSVKFQLENGTLVPDHFHITEVGNISKDFIDCGGTLRSEKVANFQLWHADDTDHRLSPKKTLMIIEESENKLGLKDLEIEVEYQQNTIGKYDLDFNGNRFVLLSKSTNCLAEDQCGIPQKKKLDLEELNDNTSGCSPDDGCC